MNLIIDRRLVILSKQIAALECHLRTNAHTDLEREQIESDIGLCYEMALDLVQQRLQQLHDTSTNNTFQADTLLADVRCN